MHGKQCIVRHCAIADIFPIGLVLLQLEMLQASILVKAIKADIHLGMNGSSIAATALKSGRAEGVAQLNA